MSVVSEDELKAIVVNYLSKSDNLTDTSFKNIKKIVANDAKVDLKLIEDNHADYIKKIIAEYKKRQRVETKDDLLHGRFSKKDSSVVMKCIDGYAAEHGIDPTEISAFFREKEQKRGTKFNDLWSRLQELLPNRSKKSIIQHANRLLIRPLTDGSFTEEDKKRLQFLLNSIGRDFQEIGKRLMKSPEDCKQMAIKLQGRKKTGKFTAEEDASIIEKVRAVCGLPDVPVMDLPVSGIAWTDVARLMDFERFPIDYTRRWPRIVKAHGPNVDITMPMLRYLYEKGVEDYSEANWLQINKINQASPSAAQTRWKALQELAALDGKTFRERVIYLMNMFKNTSYTESLTPMDVNTGERAKPGRRKMVPMNGSFSVEVDSQATTLENSTGTKKAPSATSKGAEVATKRVSKVSSAAAKVEESDNRNIWGEDEEEETEEREEQRDREVGNDSGSEVALGAAPNDTYNQSESEATAEQTDTMTSVVDSPEVVPDTYMAKEEQEAASEVIEKKKKHKKRKHREGTDGSAGVTESQLETGVEEDKKDKKKKKKHKKDRDSQVDSTAPENSVNVVSDTLHSTEVGLPAEKKRKKEKKHKKDRSESGEPANSETIDVNVEEKQLKKKKKHKKDPQ